MTNSSYCPGSSRRTRTLWCKLRGSLARRTYSRTKQFRFESTSCRHASSTAHLWTVVKQNQTFVDISIRFTNRCRPDTHRRRPHCSPRTRNCLLSADSRLDCSLRCAKWAIRLSVEPLTLCRRNTLFPSRRRSPDVQSVSPCSARRPAAADTPEWRIWISGQGDRERERLCRCRSRRARTAHEPEPPSLWKWPAPMALGPSTDRCLPSGRWTDAQRICERVSFWKSSMELY